MKIRLTVKYAGLNEIEELGVETHVILLYDAETEPPNTTARRARAVLDGISEFGFFITEDDSNKTMFVPSHRVIHIMTTVED